MGLISTEVTRRAVLDPPSDAQTASQAKPARAVGRSLAGPGWPMEQILQEIDAAGQHSSQWTPPVFTVELSQAQRERVCVRETEGERASKQASKQASEAR